MNWKIIIYTSVIIVMFGCKAKNLEIPQQQVVQQLTGYAATYGADQVVQLHTSQGNIQIKLYKETPLHRANWLHLIKHDYYNHGLFYRIVDGLVIQGGNDPERPRLKYEIPQEIQPNCFHKRGALAMASNKPEQFSSPTEFYIVQGHKYTELALNEFEQELGRKFTPEQKKSYMTTGGDPRLDGKYTVFGEVISGFEVVEKISAQKVYQTDRPVEKITFTFSH
jgi:cyclophilin family peptidyl-prolyl cis-trans isomerase